VVNSWKLGVSNYGSVICRVQNSLKCGQKGIPKRLFLFFTIKFQRNYWLDWMMELLISFKLLKVVIKILFVIKFIPAESQGLAMTLSLMLFFQSHKIRFFVSVTEPACLWCLEFLIKSNC